MRATSRVDLQLRLQSQECIGRTPCRRPLLRRSKTEARCLSVAPPARAIFASRPFAFSFSVAFSSAGLRSRGLNAGMGSRFRLPAPSALSASARSRCMHEKKASMPDGLRLSLHNQHQAKLHAEGSSKYVTDSDNEHAKSATSTQQAQ